MKRKYALIILLVFSLFLISCNKVQDKEISDNNEKMIAKEDEIKKAQSLLIKRLIYGVLVFLIVAIVKFVLGIVGDSAGEAISCLGEIFG